MFRDPDASGVTEAEPTRTPPPVRPSRVVNVDEEDERARDPEALKALIETYEESLHNVEEGEILRGRILRVDEKEVMVDIGFKSEGVIPIEEFGDVDKIQVGEEVDVFLEKMEDQDGLVVLSKQRADFVKVWDRVKEAAEKGEVVEGRLVRKIKGGAVVDLFGVEAFLPGSQIALRPPQAIESLMNQTLQFKIIKLNKRRRNIVVSRRLVLEQERESAKEEVIKELQAGQIREGYVKNITDFGAFIDLGGIDGLLHITDMSWGRVKHPSEVVSVGDKLKVKILSFEPERERISLGLKQLTEYPWDRVEEKYPVGTKVKGRVVSITEYGAFVELEKGVEGLIHVSEMSWTKHVRHPNKILTEGQEVECMVLKVDREHEKISLGLKQVEPDPWLTLDEKYPTGAVVTGKVRNLTNFGAFVELEDGIDGLVHISDMSWTRRIGHPSEILKKGEKVDVKVLNIDKEARRISLGLKQVTDDPWPEIQDRYPIGTTVNARVVKVIDRGAIVLVDNEVEGFVPASQLGIEGFRHPGEHFQADDELQLKVTRIDLANHRMVLSAKGWLVEQDDNTRAEFCLLYTSDAADEFRTV
ncbi:MAG: 30S ribosomal protein S1 [Candidatus Eisenbacteria bacterium]|nr:30S ribosomal protein S1 [Candidatus Eisenbacteria bacterium]